MVLRDEMRPGIYDFLIRHHAGLVSILSLSIEAVNMHTTHSFVLRNLKKPKELGPGNRPLRKALSLHLLVTRTKAIVVTAHYLRLSEYK